MEQIVVEVDSNIREIERFFNCLEKVINHVYGLVKTAFIEVKERLESQYELIKFLWTNETTRAEVIKAALNAIGNTKVPKGEIIHYLASKDLPEATADQFFKTLSKMIHLIENFRRLMRLRVIGGPVADNVEMYRQVDEILMAYG